MTHVVEVTDAEARVALCRAVFADLPDWFGRPEATATYVSAVANLTTIAWEADGETAGFAALTRPTDKTCDIHVMGVLRRHHGQGGGRALISACERHARAVGARFLTVQTVGPSAPDPHYEKTRAFYQACGMAALAEFPDHWGRGTPMLLMGKALQNGTC